MKAGYCAADLRFAPPEPALSPENQELSIQVRTLAASVRNLTYTTLTKKGNLLTHVNKLYKEMGRVFSVNWIKGPETSVSDSAKFLGLDVVLII